MIYLGLAALAVAAAFLFLTDGTLGGAVEPDQLARLAAGVAMLALVTAGAWRGIAHAPGARIRDLAIWAALGLACVVGYAYRDDLAGVSSRVMGDLRPGTAAVGPGGAITITRRSDGDFRVEVEVNGQIQPFIFDTGASTVVLTAEGAARLGLRPAESEYTARVSTANGTATAAPVLLDTLRIGPITERRVPAMVSRPGVLTTNLLGQTFLTRLAGYEVRGDRLILRGR